MTFKSTSVKVTSRREGSVEGDLTIKGITQKVVFSVEGPTEPAKDRGAICGWRFRRQRRSAAMTSAWSGMLRSRRGGVLVGDDVTIMLDVQFVKAA